MRGLTLLASLSHLATTLTIPTYPKKRALSAGFAIYSCTTPGTVALTFDDGPFVYTDSVLDQLASVGFQATFFLNGYNLGNIEDYQYTVDRMINEGHQVASHTYGHPDLAGLNDYDVEQQMALLSNEFTYMIGKDPVYMRPPYFSFSDRTLQVLGQLGYKVIIADIDTDDWRYSSFGGAEPSLDAYNSGLSDGGSIVLMHDVHKNTVQNILPRIIQATLQSGRKAVTVGECLGDPESNWYRVSGGSGTGSQTTEWNITESHNDVVVVHTPAPEKLKVVL
jgi:peptidoglycan/xylan/chitin deacetylase (PgdA/CDA1 family)